MLLRVGSAEIAAFLAGVVMEVREYVLLRRSDALQNKSMSDALKCTSVAFTPRGNFGGN